MARNTFFFNTEQERTQRKALAGIDNQIPNIESLQQLSRREDIHMVQAARNINSENCI